MSDELRAIARACPGCGNNESAKVEYYSAPRAEQSLADLSADRWAGFFRSKAFFTYARCARCALLYCPTYFDEASLARLYGWMGDNTAGVPVEALRRTQEGYFQIAERSAQQTGDYLEIGPDIGLFTAFAARARPDSKFFLFEPNKAVWDSLRSVCQGVREVVLRDAMEGIDEIPDASLALAVMVHVLDHLLDPVRYLATLKRKLRKDGILLIVTHNERSLLARTFGGRYPIFCLQHPQLFNPRTIEHTLRAAGLHRVAISRTINHFPAGYLMKHFLYQLGMAVQEPRLPWTLGLPLGNMATTAARLD